MEIMRRLFKEEEGQGLIEYVLIIALISIAAITIMPKVGTWIGNKFKAIDATITD